MLHDGHSQTTQRRMQAAGAAILLVWLGESLAAGAPDPEGVVPAKSPRTAILAGKHDEFRRYCTQGEAARAFARIKADFDRSYLGLPFPAEPMTYGDPDPDVRDSAKADKWRAAQDVCGRVSGVAEAGALIWVVTREDKYLAQAKEYLLKSSEWHFGPRWQSGSVPGATDIDYNDEAHFRLWRKLPLVYDQIRAQLTPGEKAKVLAHFKQRGNGSLAWLKPERMARIKPNSVASDVPSHPVRFVAMTGLAGLALWDDLPEAKEWWRFAYLFYRDQFSPWGGDDGGWAEGNAYWRGTFEHAAFQDILYAIGDPIAYSSPFWKNSPYFAVYNVQPYLHTIFGDTSNAGHFNLEPVIADYMEHLARVQQDGYLLTYANLCSDKRVRPIDKGLEGLDRTYPTACEFLVRNFFASGKPLPAPSDLAKLPPQRYFRDVGWVSMHSALGRPDEDIHITFKSSPYGSYSHSHADQNAFILNAFGESLAINSAYREFHRSPHHKQWTWQTKSKNALLIDGLGQKPQERKATGKITRFETAERWVGTTGDATVAYQSLQPKDRVERVTRDLMFVDKRYLVIRDRVSLREPGRLSWLLHAAVGLSYDSRANQALIRGKKATLTTLMVSPGVQWKATITDKFPVPVDPKYVSGSAGASYITGEWSDQQHLTLESASPGAEFTVYAVLWPEKGTTTKPQMTAELEGTALKITRPDGKVDTLTLNDASLRVD